MALPFGLPFWGSESLEPYWEEQQGEPRGGDWSTAGPSPWLTVLSHNVFHLFFLFPYLFVQPWPCGWEGGQKSYCFKI